MVTASSSKAAHEIIGFLSFLSVPARKRGGKGVTEEIKADSERKS